MHYKPPQTESIRDIQIVFMNEEQNVDNLLNVALQLGQEKKANESNNSKSNHNNTSILSNQREN